jgi:hypothetical protein
MIRGMMTSSISGSLVESFGQESQLAVVYLASYPEQGIGAFMRYPESVLRKFQVNADDFATGS